MKNVNKFSKKPSFYGVLPYSYLLANGAYAFPRESKTNKKKALHVLEKGL